MSPAAVAVAAGTAGVTLAVGWWYRPRGRGGSGVVAGPVVIVVAGVAASALVGPVVVGVVLGVAMVVRWWRPRRRAARRRAAVAAALPEVVDLLAASLEVGRPVTAALRETVQWAPAVVHGELALAVERLDAGWRRADVLDRMVDELGPEARPLVSALVAADRYGVPVADAVRRLVDDMRRRRRLDAETAARRLPVRLTIPLVVAVLPAFGLLTVLPLLLAALRGLGAEPGP